uniref:Uncharacterized protein n=1 Tax=Romanomermis culicivorax TaxID=13658 RepID=A0A915IH29_ROMCU
MNKFTFTTRFEKEKILVENNRLHRDTHPLSNHFGGNPGPFGKTFVGVLLVFRMPGGGICNPWLVVGGHGARARCAAPNDVRIPITGS